MKTIKTMKTMKNLIVIISAIFSSLVFTRCNQEVKVVTEDVIIIPSTAMCIANTTQDSVLVYLTMGSVGDTNYVQGTLGIWGITTSGNQSSFWVAPNDTLCYMSPIGKGFNGNITFGTPPVNCADTTLYPNGINLFEFNLNDNFVVNAQETIDISCVSGVNSYIQATLIGGGIYWNNGTDSVYTIKNSGLYQNDGQNGVFPFGCDSCTVITSKTPYCAGHKPYATPQKQSICNIQRNATGNGGVILVQFNGYAN